MKKYFILAIGIVLVSVFGYFGWELNLKQTGFHDSVSSTPGTNDANFQIAGVLVRNNPGLTQDVWYLVSDSPGSSADKLELDFSSSSDCSVGTSKVECSKMDLPNGTRVRLSGQKNGGKLLVSDLTAESASDLISVDKITDGDKLQSPLTITGKARGSWYFEASFPVRLVDLTGNTITSTHATAGSDWMTNDFVPFSSTISFDVTTATPADLVLAADNPSGLPQNDRDIRVRVTLLPSKNVREVSLFYYDPKLDKDASGNIMCSRTGLIPVKRELPNSDSIIYNTVNLLLQGKISPEEKSAGVSTEYPLVGLKLNSLLVNGGIATLNFSDENNKTSGGSCRVGLLWMQIEATVKQFPGIKEVRFLPETLFQP